MYNLESLINHLEVLGFDIKRENCGVGVIIAVGDVIENRQALKVLAYDPVKASIKHIMQRKTYKLKPFNQLYEFGLVDITERAFETLTIVDDDAVYENEFIYVNEIQGTIPCTTGIPITSDILFINDMFEDYENISDSDILVDYFSQLWDCFYNYFRTKINPNTMTEYDGLWAVRF